MSGTEKILVTAVGGDVGQAVVKALRLRDPRPVLWGCDMESSGAGAAFVDGFFVAPPARDPGFVAALDRACRAEKIGVVVPTNEAEIAVLAGLGAPPRLPSGARIVCQPARWLDRFGDKLRCLEALAGKVPLAPFADGADRAAVDRCVRQSGFPVVVKERRSQGAKGMRVVRNAAELEAALAASASPLVQGWIDDTGGEYSLGAFAHGTRVEIAAFRRRIQWASLSWYAESADDPEVVKYGLAVARAAGLEGSVNIQVRRSAAGVRLLEINGRFSSLVAARAASGFRDVEWSIEALDGEPRLPSPLVLEPIRFQRYFGELLDRGAGFGSVAAWQPSPSPAPRARKRA